MATGLRSWLLILRNDCQNFCDGSSFHAPCSFSSPYQWPANIHTTGCTSAPTDATGNYTAHSKRARTGIGHDFDSRWQGTDHFFFSPFYLPCIHGSFLMGKIRGKEQWGIRGYKDLRIWFWHQIEGQEKYSRLVKMEVRCHGEPWKTTPPTSLINAGQLWRNKMVGFDRERAWCSIPHPLWRQCDM